MHTNPYIGIVFFLVLPGLFVFGLLLIPLGAWLERRRERRGTHAAPGWPVLDFNDPATRADGGDRLRSDHREHRHRVAGGVRGVEYMDSVSSAARSATR